MTYKALLMSATALLFSIHTAGGDTLSDIGGRYAIAPSSKIGFSVAQVGGGGISGLFPQFSGTFELHPEDLARSRVSFTLTPGSVVTGEPRVEAFLRSTAVFDVAEYPQITFRSTRIVQVDSDSAVIDGILSARGKSRKESFKASLVQHKGRKVVFHVVGDVLRSPYGMDVGTPIYSNVVRFDMVLLGQRS